MKEISANDNPVIKKFRALSVKKQRDKLGLYIIEGPNLLEEALNCGVRIGQVLFDDEALSRSEELAGLAARTEEKKIPAAVVSPSLFLKAANTDTPQGVIAWVEKPLWTEEQFFALRGGNIIVLDRLQDPGNLGTILRTADSAGFSGALLLKGCGDIYGPKTVRAATGTLFRLPVLFCDGPEEAMALLRAHGKTVFATALESSEVYFKCDLRRDAAIVIGNEGNGICREILDEADQNITIPMEGKTESLNAGIAAGILMYESLRQRHME
ncbi:MAG: RNA methyltransferase [Firmicutes bacterium]|nr:RNA methyltransferase [Bacillota bacterium]